jgi:hypothetical protein
MGILSNRLTNTDTQSPSEEEEVLNSTQLSLFVGVEQEL